MIQIEQLMEKVIDLCKRDGIGVNLTAHFKKNRECVAFSWKLKEEERE